MTEALLALLCAFSAAVLARRLCGDNYGALVAGAAYALAPSLRAAVAADVRAGFAAALLPLVFLRFYRLNDLDSRDETPRRKAIFALGVTLALCGLCDPRVATAGTLLVWLALLVSYGLDKARRAVVWGPPFKALAWATVVAILVYLPIWMARRGGGAALGGPFLLDRGPTDFLDLLRPSSAYVGLSTLALAAAAVWLTRSYRVAARMWVGLGAFYAWAALGPRFIVGGDYVWWLPALYKGLGRIGPLRGVPPDVFGLVAHLPLALAAGYGFGGLLTHASPRLAKWLRPAGAAAVIALLAVDLLRAG